MNIKVYITTEVFDRNGKLRYKRKRKSKSFVKAFLAILLAQMKPSADVTGITDYLGVDRDLEENAASFDAESDVAGYDWGVAVGTGDTTVNVSDYGLESLIHHGVGSGQLYYSATTFGSLTVSDPNVSFTIQRDMTNSSGATITVYEEGIYVHGWSTEGQYRIFLAIRDVETAGVAVNDGECLRVTYTIKTST